MCLEMSLLCRSLELFPKLLSVISTQPQIHHSRGHTTPTFTLYQTLYLTLPPPPSLSLSAEGGGMDQMEGAEFKSHLLNSLCSCK